MSEVTRAEQLVDKLFNGPCSSWGEHANDLSEVAAELRRLSAVEARCLELEKEIERRRVHNSEMAIDLDSLRAHSSRQSELIQQAKEALERVCTHETRTSTQIYADWDNARATLSAINEWEKSNG